MIRGSQAGSAAAALEVRADSESERDGRVGSGLIRWDSISSKRVDEEGKESDGGEVEAVWVDRCVYFPRNPLNNVLCALHLGRASTTLWGSCVCVV